MSTNMDAKWRERSLCHRYLEVNPTFIEAWSEKVGQRRIIAQQICEACPVRIDCLLDALSDDDAEGMRGGFFFQAGVTTRVDQRRIQELTGVTSRTSQRQKRKNYVAAA